MARPERSYDDEEDPAGDPASKTYGYRAALGSNKYASQETAAGVFGERTSSERPRPRPVPRRGGPTQGPRPLPKPIVLPEPIATPAAIPVPGVKRIRWAGRNEAAAAGPPDDARPAGGAAPGPARPARPDDLDGAPRLSVRPLRTPAPAVTTIRVEPVPVDGFEYETASLWFSDSRGTGDTPVVTPEPEPPPPPSPTTPSPTAGTPPWLSPYTTKSERPVISWLDE